MDNAVAKKARRPSSRKAILDSALDLIAEVGANHLTLEAVATRAGISKGGLLYNFPSKQALLGGLVEQAMAEMTALLEDRDGEPRLGPRELIRRLLDRRLAWLYDAARSRAAHGMMAAMAEQPALMEPIRQFQAVLWQRVKTIAADAPGLWLVWLACEGLLLAQLHQVSPLSAEEHEQLRKRLVDEIERLVPASLPPEPRIPV